MTSISSGTNFAAHSPGDRLKQQLASAVSSGSVKAADQSALSSALDDIDAALKAGASSTAATTGRRGGGKEKIDSLITQEVKDGKLTADQATELKKLYADAAPGGHGHGGGPRSAGSGDDATTSLIDSLTAASSGSSSGATSSASTKDPVTALIDFLKTLQTANSARTIYGSTGTSSDSSLNSLLVDTQA